MAKQNKPSNPPVLALADGKSTFKQEFTASLDLPAVLSAVLFQSIKLVGAERGTLIILNEAGDPIDAAIVYFRQLIPHTMDQLRDTLRQGLAGWVMEHEQPVLVSNTSKDKRWLQRPDDAADQTGAKSAVCLPLKGPSGQVVGILTIVHSSPGFFQQEHLQQLATFADHAGSAIYNARLYHNLEGVQVRMQSLYESSIDPIVITDLEGRFTEANNRFHLLTGYLPEVLVGNELSLFYPEFDQATAAQTGQLSTGQLHLGEGELLKTDGHFLPVEVHIEKVLISARPMLQWLFRDISERKALNALQEEMIAMVYHDLRTPLSNVISALDMIETALPPSVGADMQDALAIANRSATRMQRLINSLLNIYELESGQKLTSQVKVRLEYLLQDAIQAVLPAANYKQIEIKYRLPVGLPDLYVDQDMITRVIINLLENSIKFTGSGGLVELSVKQQGDFLQLFVADNGAGIPEELSGHLFDKFIRGADTGTRVMGSGLGLAFCRLAVEAHRGQIKGENNIGKGCTISIELPIYANQVI